MINFLPAPLGEIASVVRGVTFSRTEAAAQPIAGFLPVLRAGNIKDSLVLDNDLIYVSRDKIKDRQILRQGDIVICTSSGSSEVVGKTALAEEDWEGSFGAFCAGIRANPNKCDPSYLFYYLRSPAFRSWTQKSAGANIKNIRKSELDLFEIPLPSLPEQRRIAGILEKAHGIRRKREQALVMADELLKSAFMEKFGDPVANPKGWPIVALGDGIEEVRYGTSMKCTDDSDGALPVLRIPNIAGGGVIWDDLKFASLSDKEVDKLRMQKDDIIFVRTNGNPEYIARCAVYESDREALFASYLIRVRLGRRSRFIPRYIWMALSVPSYRRVLLRETKTTAGNYNISGSGLKSLKVPKPPLSAQREFDHLYRRFSVSIVNMVVELADAETLCGSLSQRAFRGEL